MHKTALVWTESGTLRVVCEERGCTYAVTLVQNHGAARRAALAVLAELAALGYRWGSQLTAVEVERVKLAMAAA